MNHEIQAEDIDCYLASASSLMQLIVKKSDHYFANAIVNPECTSRQT